MGLYPLDAPVEVSIAVWPWGAYLGEEGKQRRASAPRSSSWRRISHDSLIPHAKASGQYLNSVLAKIEATKAGYEEAILLDQHGLRVRGLGREHLRRARRHDRHAAADRRDPRRDQPQVGHPDRPRPRLRGRRARPRPRRAVPRRRGVPVRHRRRARAGPRDRRPRDRQRRRAGPITRELQRVFDDALHGRDARYADWLDVVDGADSCAAPIHRLRMEPDDQDRALRHDPARRHAGGGHVAVRAGEAARRPPARRARDRPDRGRASRAPTPRSSSCSSCWRGERFAHAADRRLRDDAPARRRAPSDDPALRVLADCFAPVCTLVGKTWALHLEKVVKVDRDENLRMIAESIAFLVGAGQAGDLRRRALLRRLRRRPRVRAALPARRRRGRRRDRRLLRHQRRHAARSGSRRRWRRSSRRSAPTGVRVGIHCHDDAGCGVANSLAAVAAGRDPRAGDDERLRRALRQRQPRLRSSPTSSSSSATSA